MDTIKNVTPNWQGAWNFAKPNTYTIGCQVTVAIGIAVGVALMNFYTFSAVEHVYIGFPGEMLTRMLQLLTMPLMITGVFKGITCAKVNISKKAALRVGLYHVTSSIAAMCAGLFLVLYIKPGYHYPANDIVDKQIFNGPGVMNVIINMAPDNLISACMEQPMTLYAYHHPNATEEYYEVLDGFNSLSLMLSTVIVGWIMRNAENAQIFVLLFADVHGVIKSWEEQIMRFLPLGLLFLAVSHVLEIGDWETIYLIGQFMAVVAVGLIVYGAVIQPLIYAVMAQHNPLTIMNKVYPALLGAALSASSSSTLPVTTHCLEENCNIDQRVTRTMLPLVASIGKDGSMLYQVIAVVFVSQFDDIQMDLTQLALLVVATMVLTIRAPGNQEFGAITTLYILTAVHLPWRDATLLVLVEWLLDRIKTVVNVLSQCFIVSLANQLLTNEEEESEDP